MNDSLPPGGTRAFTPGQGTMAAPWYRLPPSQPPSHAAAGERPSRWFLGAMGACAALGVFLVLNDPVPTPTSSQARWDASPAERAAMAQPVAHVARAADEARDAREAREARFAAIDETLDAAVAGARLAALRANDVALRAFAAHQADRYDELRATLRAIAGHPAVGPTDAGPAVAGALARGDLEMALPDMGHPDAHDVQARTAVARHPDARAAAVVTAAAHRGGAGAADGGIGGLRAERLAALGAAEGAEFDRLYVRQALALNRALLAELDAALATIDDVELRDAVEQVRGTIDATMPAGDPAARTSATEASATRATAGR